MDIFGLTKPTKTNHETEQTNPLAEEQMLQRDLFKNEEDKLNKYFFSILELEFP